MLSSVAAFAIGDWRSRFNGVAAVVTICVVGRGLLFGRLVDCIAGWGFGYL